jgi:hypothetical protein
LNVIEPLIGELTRAIDGLDFLKLPFIQLNALLIDLVSVDQAPVLDVDGAACWFEGRGGTETEAAAVATGVCA